MPSRIKIFPIWGLIITDNMTEEIKSKIVSFYHKLENNAELLGQFEAILSMNGNSEIGSSKLDGIKNMINATVQISSV